MSNNEIKVGDVFYSKYYAYQQEATVKAVFENMVTVLNPRGWDKEYDTYSIDDFLKSFSSDWNAMEKTRLMDKIESIENYIKSRQTEIKYLKSELTKVS